MEEEKRFNAHEMWKSLRYEYEGRNPDLADAWRLVNTALNDSIGKPHHITTGEYATEKDAESAFDTAVNTDFFVNEPQVKGRRLFDDKPKKEDVEQIVKIDRILHPKKEAVASGWIWGPIAVEVKKSNMAIGPIFSQVLEYRQSVFISKILRNTRILPLVFAIFPAKDISNDLHSLQENQIILSCHLKYGNTLRFGTFGKNALEISPRGILVGGSFNPNSTKGHRGREK